MLGFIHNPVEPSSFHIVGVKDKENQSSVLDNSERKGTTRRKRLGEVQYVPVVTQSDENNTANWPQMCSLPPPSLCCIPTGPICSSEGYPPTTRPAFNSQLVKLLPQLVWASYRGLHLQFSLRDFPVLTLPNSQLSQTYFHRKFSFLLSVSKWFNLISDMAACEGRVCL